MEIFHGEGRGSYIWGRSVHNVRTEHLWADITAQTGATWADVFIILELHHVLNINSAYHIWLLHFLFLHQINEQLRFFIEAWNQHQIQIRIDLIEAWRTYVMLNAELEVYGVDWEPEGLRDEHLLESLDILDWSLWTSLNHLNEAPVEPPAGPFSVVEIAVIEGALGHLARVVDDAAVAHLWTEALILARQMHPGLF
ncbi:hypothetical protein C8F04DRAFT_1206204 [Mycena alexandri]|uniref:Integrase core domain-containing protein n=1 Tax=Mycena alexandri TaxID=1745969 RepID=A0AAD6TGR1_9AGAR|nr:hypothetical protein C8F04DRAFT_1206204 [Mycena alexandri]